MSRRKRSLREKFFSSAREDVARADPSRNGSYRLAFTDTDFLLREELRPIRLQLELLKPDLIQQEHNVHSTVVIYGSARQISQEKANERLEEARAALEHAPTDSRLQARLVRAERRLYNSRYYEEARRLGTLITQNSEHIEGCKLLVVTGGGPGIMEAANRGAYEAGGKSIGLNIVLPAEQTPNPYITPELCFQFHYFAIRKMHFLMRARALIAFPGGFGTLDELFETLTLIQTGKTERLPILLFGEAFWRRLIDFDLLVEEGYVDAADLELFNFVETAEQAWDEIATFYNLGGCSTD